MATALLQDQHNEELAASAITEEVAAARGYKTVEARAHLAHMGFGRSQGGAGPWLAIPMFAPGDTAPSALQVKPTSPRTGSGGKPVKYESPAGSVPVLDVNPLVQGNLSDPTVPIWITEGVKKGDSIVSQGGTAISLTGVWGWKSGSLPNEDWGKVALQDREVYLAFDSDALTNPKVWDALDSLTKFLTKRGAKVFNIQLPVLTGAAKTGIDDYLASGQTLTNVKQLVAAIPQRPPVEKACMTYRLDDGDEIELCNFTLKIVRDITVDDGANQERVFDVEAVLSNGKTITATVKAEKFDSMEWVTPALGSRAVIYAFGGAKDKLREATMLQSDPAESVIYGHTGWRDDGRWVFPGGAISAKGLDTKVEVDIHIPQQDRIKLPAPAGQVIHLQRSLDLIDEHSGVMPIRLFLAAYRATLGSVPYAIWLAGKTGCGKSTLATLAQAHYGQAFEQHRFLSTWESTENYIEEVGFRVKDMLFVVDDWRPKGRGRTREVAKADRVIRSQVNDGGRGRLTRTSDIRADRQVRGMVLSTAEDLPTDESSLLARLLVVELDSSKGANTERFKRMSVHQGYAAAGDFAHAMSDWLFWLAPRLDAVRARHADRMKEHRVGFATGHARMATMGADMFGFAEIFFAYCVSKGAITRERHDELLDALRAEIIADAEEQESIVASTAVSNEVHQAILTGLRQGKLRIEGMQGADGLGDWVGWEGGGTVHLDPHALATSLAPILGYQAHRNSIVRALHDAGIVDKSRFKSQTKNESKLTITATHNGQTMRVIPTLHHVLMGGSYTPDEVEAY